MSTKAEEVTITTYKDKNMKQWEISVNTRLKAELLKLKLQRKSEDPDEPLFASASVNLRKVWSSTRTMARLSDLKASQYWDKDALSGDFAFCVSHNCPVVYFWAEAAIDQPRNRH